MIDVEQQLAETFRSRADDARPEPDLDAVLSHTARARVADRESFDSRRRWKLGAAAALLIVVGAVAALFARSNLGPDTSPDLPPAAPVTYPDQVPPAPPATEAQRGSLTYGALQAQGASLRLRMGTRDSALFAESITDVPDDSPWKSWGTDGRVITDSDGTTPAALYVATCCDPGGVIWRNGVEFTSATRIDYVLDGVLRATVDPSTSTVRIGDFMVVEPGALDVAVLDRQTALVLIGSPIPRYVLFRADDFSANAHPDRQVVLLPEGTEPCAVVSLEAGVVILVGGPQGADACVGDRALVVDPLTGTVASTIRLPASVRSISSDHRSRLIAIADDGNVLLATFDAKAGPSWITLLEGDYLSAYLW